ncbi:tRNA (N(6)-L-threonylcarbamoyladenosine(37)-C(2))-methylthiotransferase MtaB [Methylocella silvestris]|uniref:tRNA (N(6)-L-threonylcarbamoyladenosine(37)-C(2))-methylthiotransferase MtaB n=1 Tax=Methylocella silvestris TaxID=199596 RepID=A0A2J7TIV3_METSI|nr:tRNA (N(6)-L-threonylcarbamoyladenosine(37)-C(2))-methylthiotransferase MtaB [Methylocella silvestris]PNG26695.1 tRNA (N(6)-L-threonylcarbamoyladenosine(37)-C(2))-methylthiotransferase MtaB [Methylocella silvestris]
MVRAVEVASFGCRLNLVESEAMRRAAECAGRENLVIVNTCAVTGEAVRQARQTIRRIRRERPSAEIVVTGCAAEIDPWQFSQMPEVSRVLGNAHKSDAAAWASLQPAPPQSIMDAAGPLHIPAEGVEDHTRAFLAVQTGCDHRCTFCIIPFARGPSRSSPAEAILASVRRLTDQGFREIVLTGVDLTSYGQDLGDIRLGGLVKAILKAAPDLERLRLSSIDCIEADADLFAAFAEEPRLAPHLHLSLQAGDDMILKRMKRRHLRADAVRLCADLKRLRPDIVFGADLIAGFPTETDAMFENTARLIEDCGLAYLHVFPFSPRPGTPAAKMPAVAPALVKQRAGRLRLAGETALARHHATKIGATVRVLTERGGFGRAADFTLVKTEGAAPAQMLDIRIARDDGKSVSGAVLPGGRPARAEGAFAALV